MAKEASRSPARAAFTLLFPGDGDDGVGGDCGGDDDGLERARQREAEQAGRRRRRGG